MAVSDEIRMTVRPLGVVTCVGPKRDAASLRRMLEGLDVKLLVVGLPLLDSGEEGASAARCRTQGEDLARRLQLPLEFADESDTTREASRIQREGRAAAKLSVDALAAAILLEEWLRARGPESGAR